MKLTDLKEEIEIEIELIETTIKELLALYRDVSGRSPTVREKTAAAAFLAQFYGGVENILKRICKFYGVPVPTCDTWHMDLFKQFCEPPKLPLPCLFDWKIFDSFAPYRKFRHVVYHGYGVQLDWERMQQGIEGIEYLFNQFKSIIYSYLQLLESH
ncbi:MAG TPA: hypothetical protein VI387_04355 [Candidatus Brocadiales bacterium]|nr:hypothetical protein [Candidatus Brocadiales bacterium]